MIQLSDHFDCKRLLRFTFPSIIMMVFTSIYSVADGFFVSNFVGKTPFTAVNFIMPVLMILGCVGFMFGAGGGGADQHPAGRAVRGGVPLGAGGRGGGYRRQPGGGRGDPADLLRPGKFQPAAADPLSL